MLLRVLDRFKVIKDLLLLKLDNLESLMQTTNSRLEQLSQFSRTQLENEASLLQASIHTINTLQQQVDILTEQQIRSNHLLLTNARSFTQPVVLLGSKTETSLFAPLLQNQGCAIVEVEWEWETELAWHQFSDQQTFLLCKIPTTAQHWGIVQKLGVNIAHQLLVLAFIQPPQSPGQ